MNHLQIGVTTPAMFQPMSTEDNKRLNAALAQVFNWPRPEVAVTFEDGFLTAWTASIPDGTYVLQLPDQRDPWYESMAELAAIYGEMCAINVTPRKEQTAEQADRLTILRAECVAVHYRRIALVKI